MIRGVHAMFYSSAPDELRAFFRDKLGLRANDIGGGWLIFDVPEADVGCHPARRASHAISFYCDDIHGTVAALKKKGVRFTSKIEDQGWGIATTFRLPGAGEVTLYEPRYEKKKKRAPRRRR